MERTRERERCIRDSRLLYQERPTSHNKPRVPQQDAYELALKCYLQAPSHMTAYALRAADIARMTRAAERIEKPANVVGLREPPVANGAFNIGAFSN